jgi:peptide/nickel transport system substrate-binding protein
MRYSRATPNAASRPLGVALLLPLLLPACGSPASEARQHAVFYASGADLQSINPLVAVHPLAKAVQKHVLFLTLATYDASLEPIPRLAEWAWNADRTTLTFKLRHDVRWHDAVATTARDVAMTLEYARDSRTAYPRARDLEAVVEVAAPDSHTVHLRFARRQPIFPDVLTDLAILPAHLLADVSPESLRSHPFNTQPVGNGPFRFVEHRPNDRWIFERSPDFPAELGRPHLERFVIAVVDEPTTKLAALTSGELDFAGIAPAHTRFVTGNPKLRVVEYPMLFVTGLVWNLRRPLFADPAVRRALTQAIDRTLIVRAHAYGFGAVADGPVPPEHPWYEPVESVSFDPEEAKRALTATGWEPGPDGVRQRGGERFRFDLLTVGSGALALEQMLEAQLRHVGVEARVRALELATFLAVAQGAERDFDALVIGTPGDLSLGHVAAMYESVGGPVAYPGYASTAFDAAVRAARGAVSESALRAAWQEAQRILARDHPTTWLYHSRGVQGASRRIVADPPDLRGELAGIAGWRVGVTP